MRRTIAVIGVISTSAVVLAACGSTTSSNSRSAIQGGPPQPTESIAAFASRFQAAAASGNCSQLQAIFADDTTPNCPELVAGNRGFKVLATAAYGTGGVIDATTAKSPRGFTWTAALNKQTNKWLLSVGFESGRTVGTTAADTSGFARAVNGTIDALRSKNCAAFIKYSFTTSNTPQACVQPFGSSIARALVNDKAATPKSLGGNSQFQFYSISLKSPTSRGPSTYLTFPVATTIPGPGVTYPYVTLSPK